MLQYLKMEKSTATSKVGLASTARSPEHSALDSADIKNDYSAGNFTSAAIGMGWQLAIIVLIPIIGGYKLDQKLATVPLWTIVGLIISMIGSVLVIRRALALFGNFAPTSTTDPLPGSKVTNNYNNKADKNNAK